MKNYEGILLCSDFDDTIAVRAKVSKENIEAVNYFKERGGMFTLCSGRQYSFFNELRNEMDFNVPYAGLNGSLITDLSTGENVRGIPIAKSDVALIYNIYKTKPEMKYNSFFAADKIIQLAKTEGKLRIRLIDATVSDLPTLEEIWVQSAEDICFTVSLRADGSECVHTGIALIDKFFEENIYKTVVHTSPSDTTPENVSAIRDTIISLYGSRVAAARSWAYGVEVQNINATKGSAIKFLKEYTGARLAVAIGNYENDTPMIKEADLGVAVGNCFPECIEAASIVTVPCGEHAVADLIYNHL